MPLNRVTSLVKSLVKPSKKSAAKPAVKPVSKTSAKVPIKSLGRAELCEQLMRKMQDKLTKVEAKQIVDCYFEIICATLEQGENVNISGLGSFRLRDKKARPGRNPKTKQEYTITARRVVTLQAGPKLRKQVAATIRSS
jgi:integration host factor subunit alpha